jgi:hypothetical protein
MKEDVGQRVTEVAWYQARAAGTEGNAPSPKSRTGPPKSGQVAMSGNQAITFGTADPMLGPLQDNGGFAPTMMPAATSPAVGSGADCPSTDARGHARPSRCTLGAIEADGTVGGCPSCRLLDAAVSDSR